MFRSTPYVVLQRFENRTPVFALLGLACVFGALLAILSLELLGTPVPSLLAFTAIVAIAAYGMTHLYPHSVLGLCNAVTLFRAALVAFLFGAVLNASGLEWSFWGLAVLAFALDGLDGWLARHAGLSSAFGARFDMETDAGLAATVSLFALVQGMAGPEILILGFMRYAFFAASFIWPMLQGQLPQSMRRKVICVFQIAALILVVFPLTPEPIILPMIVATVLLLVWSFFVDIQWLARRRA